MAVQSGQRGARGPVSYELDGEQYIAVAQGSGGVVMVTVGDELQRNKINHNRLLYSNVVTSTTLRCKLTIS